MGKLVLNRAGIRKLLRDQQPEVERRARNIASAAGDGFEPGGQVGRNRARATVGTETFDAILAQSQNGALTSAVDAGRD